MNTKVAIVAAAALGAVAGFGLGYSLARRNAAQEKDELQSSLDAAHKDVEVYAQHATESAKTVEKLEEKRKRLEYENGRMSYQVQQMNEAKRIRKLVEEDYAKNPDIIDEPVDMEHSSQEAYEAVPESKRMEVRYYTVDDVLCDSSNVVIEDVNEWIGEMGAQSTLGYLTTFYVYNTYKDLQMKLEIVEDSYEQDVLRNIDE
nr:MAG TPA: Protein of unknown function (DUF1043) [Caudoviricetes sp.]